MEPHAHGSTLASARTSLPRRSCRSGNHAGDAGRLHARQRAQLAEGSAVTLRTCSSVGYVRTTAPRPHARRRRSPGSSSSTGHVPDEEHTIVNSTTDTASCITISPPRKVQRPSTYVRPLQGRGDTAAGRLEGAAAGGRGRSPWRSPPSTHQAPPVVSAGARYRQRQLHAIDDARHPQVSRAAPVPRRARSRLGQELTHDAATSWPRASRIASSAGEPTLGPAAGSRRCAGYQQHEADHDNSIEKNATKGTCAGLPGAPGPRREDVRLLTRKLRTPFGRVDLVQLLAGGGEPSIRRR